jgi:hypothetical protein
MNLLKLFRISSGEELIQLFAQALLVCGMRVKLKEPCWRHVQSLSERTENLQGGPFFSSLNLAEVVGSNIRSLGNFLPRKTCSLAEGSQSLPEQNLLFHIDSRGTKYKRPRLKDIIYKPIFRLIKLAYSLIFRRLVFVGSWKGEECGVDRAPNQVPWSYIEGLRNSQDRPQARTLNASFQITNERSIQSAFLVEFHLGQVDSFAYFPHGLSERSLRT